MERSSPQPIVSRSTVAVLFVSLLVVVTIRLLALAPSPYGPAAAEVLRSAGSISAVVSVLLLAVFLAAVTVMRGRPRDSAPGVEEEPWLAEPRLPRTRARCPLIGFIDLGPSAGGSTMALNLSVLLATEGTRRVNGERQQRPRPLCLLAEGPLTETLGLSSEPLREHIATYPGRITQDVVDLAVRHPSGCELLCVQRGQLGRHHVRLLRDVVERYYDALIVDCSAGDSWLREGLEDVSDAIVLVALPSAASAEASARAAERAVAGHRLAMTALLVNRVRAGQKLPEQMTGLFENAAQIPDDYTIDLMDREAFPWCLDPLSPAGRLLRRIAWGLLPELFSQDRNAA
jgi:hypothetical protein